MPKSPLTPSDSEPVLAEVVGSEDAVPVQPVPEVKNATSRVTIAFPFSQIRTQEPSAELAELAALLADVITALQDTFPDAPLEQLARRAQTLRDRTA